MITPKSAATCNFLTVSKALPLVLCVNRIASTTWARLSVVTPLTPNSAKSATVSPTAAPAPLAAMLRFNTLSTTTAKSLISFTVSTAVAAKPSITSLSNLSAAPDCALLLSPALPIVAPTVLKSAMVGILLTSVVSPLTPLACAKIFK